MANSILTIQMITRKALAIFRNSNLFLKVIDKQYDSQFAKTGYKIGASLKIRLPNEFVVRTGTVAVPQATTENYVNLNVASQKGVDVAFTSADMALSLDDFGERILAPMVNPLAGAVAADIMTGTENIPNLVHATSTGATVTPTTATWLQAGAVLDLNSAPRNDRMIVVDAMTQSRVVSSLTGLFNPQDTIAKQFHSGMIGMNVLGFDWGMDQTVKLHTAGTFTTGAMSATANQTGGTITVGAISGTLKAGDIITIAGVNGVNRVNKQDTGQLQTFAVLNDVANTGTTINIYPPINPPVSGQNVAYQNVTAAPAGSAVITAVIATAEVYRKNFAFHPTACTMATADLDKPGGVDMTGREQYDGISMRMVRAYDVYNDIFLSRLDILYGFAWPRPEWAVVIADAQ